MTFAQLARRCQTGIVARLMLKLSLIGLCILAPIAWTIAPQAAIWQQVASGIGHGGEWLRETAIRTLRGGGGPAQSALTDLDRLPAVKGFAASEIRCLALAVYYEAGREPREAQIGVAQVALGRATAAKTPRLLCKVIYNGLGTPGACLFDTACRNIGVSPRQDVALGKAVEVAVEVASGKASHAPIANATHFHETRNLPPWSRNLFKIATIGKLNFYVSEQPETAADPVPEPGAAAASADRSARQAAPVARKVGQGQGQGQAAAPQRDTSGLSRQVFGID